MKSIDKINYIIEYNDLPEEEFEPRYIDVLEEFSYDQDDTVRVYTAWALSRYSQTEKEPQAIQLLLRLLKDTDAMVRLEAYDSLGYFDDKEVIQNLEKSIKSEKDDLARSYAIDSWIYAINNNYEEHKLHHNFLLQILEDESDEHCILACLFGEYLFGEKTALNDIILYLNNQDYHIRCFALTKLDLILDEGVTEKEVSTIKNNIKKLLEHEKTVAVRDRAENILERILE